MNVPFIQNSLTYTLAVTSTASAYTRIRAPAVAGALTQYRVVNAGNFTAALLLAELSSAALPTFPAAAAANNSFIIPANETVIFTYFDGWYFSAISAALTTTTLYICLGTGN